MKTIKKCLAGLLLALLCAQGFAKEYPDNTFQEIPKDGYAFTENAGTVVRYMYNMEVTRAGQKTNQKRSALVYLPYGYDQNVAEDQYSVLYLHHGGGQSPEWLFTGEYSGSLLKSMLDRMIDQGLIRKNLIVCALSLSGNYYKEFQENLMPDFEKKYHIIKDRDHRAFGGFSMGAMATWTMFEHCLKDISFFIPISGDSWALGGNQGGTLSEPTARFLERMVASQGMTKDDFKIYAGCGEHEIATPNLTPQIEAMKNLTDTFVYTENFESGNLYYILCQGSGHDMMTVLRTLYNALPKF